MVTKIELHKILNDPDQVAGEQKSLFALVVLGLIDSLATGAMSVDSAVGAFFHVDNCLFVHGQMPDRNAEQIMSRGVQLPDLFLVLPTAEAQREFQRELATMRTLCLSLLQEPQLAA